MKVLGIETSCDETTASIVERVMGKEGQISGKILSNIVYSQIDEHALFGGVVPEIASRAHLDKLDHIIEEALSSADCTLNDLDGIAVTAGPGLVGGLMTGMMTAKAICASANVPYLAINHLEGHALTPRLTDGVQYPYMLLLVSGGHSQFVEVTSFDNYKRLATTIDDALGEAFDKTAKLLSLGHPGGPQVEQAAVKGDPKSFTFPRPLNSKTDFNFSFSGLKTAVRKAAQENAPLAEQTVFDICASFQQAIIDVLVNRTKKMIVKFEASNPDVEDKVLVVAGGVAANKAISSALVEVCEKADWKFIAPPLQLCTDNGAMIAWAGIERLTHDKDASSAYVLAPRSRWPLDEQSQAIIGKGRRGAKA